MRAKKILVFACFYFSLSAQQVEWTDTLKGIYVRDIKLYENNIYLASNSIFLISKISPSGQILQVLQTEGKALHCGGILLDSIKNIYTSIWASSNNGTFAINNNTYSPGTYLIKLSPQFNIIWCKTISNNDLVPTSMQFDRFQNICTRYGHGGGMYTYDKNGIFVNQIPCGDGNDFFFDKFNNIYLIENGMLTRRAPSGALYWSIPAPADTRLCGDDEGNCYFSTPGYYGTSTLQKTNNHGYTQWTKTMNYSAGWAIQLDPNGDLYEFSKYDAGNSTYPGQVKKYDANGTLLWTLPLPYSESYFGRYGYIAFDAGNLYFTTNSHFNRSNCLVKISGAYTPPITSLPELANKNLLTVSPNPNCCVFNVNYVTNETGELNMKLYNLNGQCLLSQQQTDFNGQMNKQLDLSSFDKGVYVLEIMSRSKKETRKLVVE